MLGQARNFWLRTRKILKELFRTQRLDRSSCLLDSDIRGNLESRQLGTLEEMETLKVRCPGVGITVDSGSFIKSTRRLRGLSRLHKLSRWPQVPLLSPWSRRRLMVAAEVWVVL